MKSKSTAAELIALFLLLCLFGVCSVMALTQFRQQSAGLRLGVATPMAADELLDPAVQPGEFYEQTIYIENQWPVTVRFRLYCDRLDSDLAGKICITLSDGEDLLYTADLAQFDVENAVTGELAPGQRQYLTLRLSLPQECENDFQGQALTFGFSAQATPYFPLFGT